jgi:hypothetical protein
MNLILWRLEAEIKQSANVAAISNVARRRNIAWFRFALDKQIKIGRSNGGGLFNWMGNFCQIMRWVLIGD